MAIPTLINPLGHDLSLKLNEVIIDKNTEGAFSFDVPTSGRFEIIAIGGGGGSHYTNGKDYFTSGKGAGGAGFVGSVRLERGLYNGYVGKAGTNKGGNRVSGYGETGGTTYIEDVIYVHGGKGGYSYWFLGSSPGQLPNATIYSDGFYNIEVNNLGKVGDITNGLGSEYSYGKGGVAAWHVQDSTGGYIKVRYIGL